MELNEISYAYYNSMFSYVKIIMELLIKKGHSHLEGVVMSSIFNNIIRLMNQGEIRDMIIVSAFIEKKLLSMKEKDCDLLIDNLYERYINSMIINFSNGDFELTKVFFKAFDNEIRRISGYTEIYGENNLFCENAKSF